MTFRQTPDSFDPAEVQRLLKQSYWASNRTLEVVAKCLEHSLCFGFVNEEDGKLMAFARVVTDHVLIAYLCDVIVDEPHRGKGLGKELMGRIMAHPDLVNLRHFLLATRDAHSLYSRFGFLPLADPTRWMNKHQEI